MMRIFSIVVFVTLLLYVGFVFLNVASLVYGHVSNNHILATDVSIESVDGIAVDLSHADKGEIFNIIIDSRGGSAEWGLFLVETMIDAQKRGVTINCYGGEIVASAALLIYAGCGNFYSLVDTRFLWHHLKVRPGDYNTAQQLADLAVKTHEESLQFLDLTRIGLGIRDIETFMVIAGQDRTVDVNELNSMCGNRVKVIKELPSFWWLHEFYLDLY